MKNLKNTLEFKYLFLLIIITMAVLSSCKKDDDNGSANIMVTNSAEGSSPQELMLDNATVSNSRVAYTESSNYLSVKTGNHQAKFVNSGTTDATVSFNASLQQGQHYSLYYTNDNRSSAAAYVFTQDDLSAPPAGKAKVRFVHLSSAAATTVDFGLGTGNKLATGLAYGSASAYYAVDANSIFLMYVSGSSTATVSLPTTITIEAGKIYTIYVSGTSTETITFAAIVQN